jgi:hypothetical protein
MSFRSNRPRATPRHGQSSAVQSAAHGHFLFYLAPPYPIADRGSRLNDLSIVAPGRRGSVRDDGNPDSGCLAMAAPVAPYVAETQGPASIGPVSCSIASRRSDNAGNRAWLWVGENLVLHGFSVYPSSRGQGKASAVRRRSPRARHSAAAANLIKNPTPRSLHRSGDTRPQGKSRDRQDGQDNRSGHVSAFWEDAFAPSRTSRMAVEFKKVARSP